MNISLWIKQFIKRTLRNESSDRSLEVTAELIKRSAFTSEPPRTEFQAKLLEKMLRTRRNQSVSMVDRTFRLVMLSIRALTAVPVIASVLILAIFASTLQPLAGGVRHFSELLIPAAYARDNFSVDATASDVLGVASSTSFVITSKQPLKREDLEHALKIVPALEYRLVERSAQEFVVEPLTTLAPRTLYRIMIDSNTVADNGITIARPFSFAFEVGEKLRVISTLPRDKTSGVPIRTGIEFTLSHEGIENPNDIIKVFPSFHYTVETKGRKLLIKPIDVLKPGTIYTVTLSKEARINGSEEALGKDVSVSFETEQSVQISAQFYLNEQTAEFSPDQKPGFPVYGLENLTVVPQVHAVVYRFESAEAYGAALERFEATPYWSWYQRQNFKITTTSLKESARVDLAVERSDYSSFLHFPTTIAAGWYVADITVGRTTKQLLFQVSPWEIFSTSAANQAVIWVNNAQHNSSVEGLSLTTVSGTVLGATNAQGLATIAVQALGTTSSPDALRYIIVGKGQNAEVVAISGTSNYAPYDEFGERRSASSEYWQYVTTDRQVYQTGDTAKVWGFVKPRFAGIPNPGTVRVTLSSGGTDWYGNDISIVEKTVPLTLQSFNLDVPLTTLSAGYYTLQVFAGDTLITSQSLSIQQYEKPVLTLAIKPSSYAVKVGEPFSATIKGSFFDGTPAARVPLTYEFGNETKKIVLDDNGQARVELLGPSSSCAALKSPEKVSEECFFPATSFINVRPQGAEYGEANISTAVNIFGADVYINHLDDISINTTTVEVSTTIFAVDSTKLKDGSVERSYHDPLAGNLPNFVGKPVVGAPVEGVLEQTVYQKVSQGNFYNEFTKQTEERFVTVASTSVAERFTVVADANGRVTKRFTIKPNVSYALHLRTIDKHGFPEYARTFFYGQSEGKVRSNYYSPYGGLMLAATEQPAEYIPGDTVDIILKRSDDTSLAQSGKILYLRSNGRSLETEVRTDTHYSFTFSNDDVPSTYLMAARFDAGDYQTTNEPTQVFFKQKTRELQVTVTSSKPVYEPGEQATVKVQIRDAAGQPVTGRVNLNVVDEAYYAFNPESANPLVNLYTSLGNPFSAVKRTHEYLKLQSTDIAAGLGGCFAAGTLVTMADGTTRPIESIVAGDSIKTFRNPLQGTYAPALVDRTFEHIVHELVVVNGTLFVTPEHRVFINSGWQTIGSAKIGDVLLSAEGKPMPIASLKRIQGTFAVYNLEVKDFHTFIAGGYFVHNDKGGDRTNFVDTATNLSGVTNPQGEAIFTFTLPDNITSWRATAQAITEKLYAGVSTTPVIVTKPVFVQPHVAPSYVAGDKPVLAFAAYGSVLPPTDRVQFSFSAPTLGITENKTEGLPFTNQYVPLPQLVAGEYDVRFGVSSPRGNDAVRVPIKVLSSLQRETAETAYDVVSGTTITGKKYSPTKVVIMSKERGSLYEPLVGLSSTLSDRFDERLAFDVAATLRRIYFGETTENLPLDVWGHYQTPEHGIGLLPYGGSDPYLAMLASGVADTRLDVAGLNTYWYALLNNPSTPREEVIMALVGLAAQSEPVLLPLRSMAAVKDLTLIERSYVALGATFAGDDQLARSLYRTLTDNSSVIVDEGRQLVGITDKELSRQTAGTLAIVGARLNELDNESWWKTLRAPLEENAPSMYHLEQALYLAARLPHLKDDEQKFSLIYRGNEKNYTLARGSTVSLELPSLEDEKFVFGTSTGKIVALARFERPLENDVNTPGLSLERQYLVNGIPTTTFTFGDIVEIRLYPQLGSENKNTTYELSDSLPSGLAFLGQTYSWYWKTNGIPCQPYFPYAVEGQEVKFFISDSWNKTRAKECAAQSYVSYKARVRGAGEFVAEPAVIQSFERVNIRSYGKAGEISITTTAQK